MKQLIILMCLITSLAYVGCRKKSPELPPSNKSNVKMETAMYENYYLKSSPSDSLMDSIIIKAPIITDSVMNHGLVTVYMQKAINFAGTMDLNKWYILPCTDIQAYPPFTNFKPKAIHYSFSYSHGLVRILITPPLGLTGMVYNFKITTYRNI